jgi:hypothetical protein
MDKINEKKIKISKQLEEDEKLTPTEIINALKELEANSFFNTFLIVGLLISLLIINK